MLRFIIGNVEDFETVGIDITTDRKSIDGIKAMKHIEHLTDDQFNIVRFDSDFKFKSGESLEEMLLSDEWLIEE